MQSEQAASDQQVARPLRVLAPLIKDDLKKGKEAAERASMPFYIAAGEKMIEAKAQLEHGEFGSWVTRNFEISRTTAFRYMKLAGANGAQMFPAGNISSMRDFRRQHLGEDAARRTPEEEEAIEAVLVEEPIEAARRQGQRFRQKLDRVQKRRAQYDLALEIISAGYRVLAAKLHPDVPGGSTEKMAALNQARDRLKRCA